MTMNEEKDIQEELVNDEEVVASEPGKYDALMAEQSTKRLTGMYKNWFLDYASYVILERVIPLMAQRFIIIGPLLPSR